MYKVYVRGNRYKIRSTKAITLFFVLYYKNTGSTSTRMYFYFPYCHYGSSTRTWTSQNLKQRTANHVITVGGIDFVFFVKSFNYKDENYYEAFFSNFNIWTKKNRKTLNVNFFLTSWPWNWTKEKRYLKKRFIIISATYFFIIGRKKLIDSINSTYVIDDNSKKFNKKIHTLAKKVSYTLWFWVNFATKLRFTISWNILDYHHEEIRHLKTS